MLLILVEMLAEKIDQDDANHRCGPLPVLLWRQFRLQEHIPPLEQGPAS